MPSPQPHSALRTPLNQTASRPGSAAEFTARRNGGGAFQRWDYTQTGYDAAGNRSRTSIPFSISSSTTDLPSADLPNQTVTGFDGLGRAVSVTTPDGETSTVSYLGASRTATDPTGASRRIRQDALGRIVQVREPDPLTGSLDSGDLTDTFYEYGLLDNLTHFLKEPSLTATARAMSARSRNAAFSTTAWDGLLKRAIPSRARHSTATTTAAIWKSEKTPAGASHSTTTTRSTA